MKKHLLTLLTVFACIMASAQSKAPKIGYIDMNYILDKVPDYAEAKNQLDQKTNKWKQELDAKRNEITKLKESLQAEKALLTKELIEEREEEIVFLEKEVSDFQEKKFGPKGELITQKAVLVKPIQDQIFTIVQDLAETRKYDFVFDKSSDLTMLFAAKKYDISEFVVKRLTRTAKTQKLSGKEVKNLEAQEKKEELESDPDFADRQKALEDKKAARQKAIDERKAAAVAKREAAIAKRDQMIQDREAKKNGTAAAKTAAPAKATEAKAKTQDATDDDDDAPPAAADNKATTAAKAKDAAPDTKPSAADKAADAAAKREKAAQDLKEERARKLEERKKAIEDRKKELEAQREAAKKAREDKKNAATTPAKDTPPQTPASTTDGDD